MILNLNSDYIIDQTFIVYCSFLWNNIIILSTYFRFKKIIMVVPWLLIKSKFINILMWSLLSTLRNAVSFVWYSRDKIRTILLFKNLWLLSL